MRLKAGHGDRKVGLRKLQFLQPMEKYQNEVILEVLILKI